MILNPNEEPKIIKNPNEVLGVVIGQPIIIDIPNKNGRLYPASEFSKIIFKQDNVVIGEVKSWEPSDKPTLTSSSAIPELNITCHTISATTRKLKANFTLENDLITFKYKDKTFAIHPVNEKLAKKLVKSKMNILITYLQYDKDDGIVELVKFLCGLKYEESCGNEPLCFFSDEVIKEWEKEAAKQIADDIDKELLKTLSVSASESLSTKYLTISGAEYENMLQKEKEMFYGKKQFNGFI